MGLGVSIVLIAVGAILRFAVHLHSTIASTTVNWHIVGDILMVVGGLGFLAALVWMASASRRATTVIDRRDPTVNP
jgi:Na+/phosphate symporter